MRKKLKTTEFSALQAVAHSVTGKKRKKLNTLVLNA